MKQLITTAALALAMSACAASGEIETKDDSMAELTNLAGSEWTLDREGQPFIRFEGDGKVAGSGGCNNFFGQYSVETGNEIKIGPLASTKKACMGEAGQYESEFFGLLESASNFKASHLELSLMDGNGEMILTLKRADWD